MKVVMLGNAGAGKSTLARRLFARQSAARLSLDEVAFRGGTERRPRQDSVDDLMCWISGEETWIIEGCYAGILQPVLPYGDALIVPNSEVDACMAHCRSRPWEPETFSSRQEQDENLDNLLQWVGSCEMHTVEYGLPRRRALYESLVGKNWQFSHTGEYESLGWIDRTNHG